MADNKNFSLVLAIIGIVAVLVNALLISVILKMRDRKFEVNLAILMAIVDTMLPIAATITGFTNYLSKPGSTFKLLPCAAKGTIDYIMIPLSIMLGCIIAVERCSRVLGKPVPYIAKFLFFGYFSGYVVCIFIAVNRGMFYASASGLNCAPKLDNFFAKMVLFLLGFNLLFFLIITLTSYGLILWYAGSVLSSRNEFIEMRPAYQHQPGMAALPKSNSKPLWQRRSFIARTLATCIIYTIFLAPLSVLMMMESNLSLPNMEVGSIVISLFIGMISISNPILVLFAHSVIYQQFKKSFLEIFYSIFPSRNPSTNSFDN